MNNTNSTIKPTYLPVFSSEDLITPEPSTNDEIINTNYIFGAARSQKSASPVKKSNNTAGNRDPLYAAMLGTTIGSPNLSNTNRQADLSMPPNRNTLDEPVMDTLKRDLQAISDKLQVVLLMNKSQMDTLQSWDMWGPLIMCTGLATGLGLQSSQTVHVFTLAFVLVWLGSLVVTLNSRLLGFRISLLQTVCLLGYCLFPLSTVAVVSMLMGSSGIWWWLKLLMTGAALVWSTIAAIRTLSDPALEDRRMLAVYPIFLFYFGIAWMILVVKK